MTGSLSQNTQAILLLTAPLLTGPRDNSAELLTPGEYKRLARYLRERELQPLDLIQPNSAALLQECQSIIPEERLKYLLARGFQLSQAVDRWYARSIWVVSRADPAYPRCIKNRLREDSPAIFYGCGPIDLLDHGGLAVVGSRHVTDELIDYAISVGVLAAKAGRKIVSGGAKGVDQAAVRGALETGGCACSVLSDSLEKAAINPNYIDFIRDRKLLLVSQFDPKSSFSVGNAMQRNKIIYAFSDAALVVNSDLKKGGTWSGAKEQLDKFRFVPVYVRASGQPSTALQALQEKGAFPWPEPTDSLAFQSILESSIDLSLPNQGGQRDLDLFAEEIKVPQGSADCQPCPTSDPVCQVKQSDEPTDVKELELDQQDLEPSLCLSDNSNFSSEFSSIQNTTAHRPSEILFETVRSLIQKLLMKPMNDEELATELGVSRSQLKIWLQRLVDEGEIEKRKRPAVYVLREAELFQLDL